MYAFARRAITRAVALVAVIALLAGLPGPSGAAEPYEINVILSLTGFAAFAGKEIVDALHLVEDDVNKTGGIQGRPIKFAISDDTSNPQVTVQLMTALVAKRAPIVIGSDLTAMCNAQIPLITNQGPVVYCTSPVIEGPPGSFVFSSGYSTLDQFRVALKFLRNRGLRRLAMINTTDASGATNEKSLTALLAEPQNADLSMVAAERFNPTDLTVAAQIAHIKAAAPQALISYVTGTSFGTVLHGIQDGGLTVPIVSSSGNMGSAQMAGYKNMAPKELLFPAQPLLAPDEITDRATKQGIVASIEAFKQAGFKPDTLYAIGWDAGQLTVQALRKIGLGATAPQIRDYINGVRGWHGSFGAYDFRAVPQRGLAEGGVMMIRWNPDTNTFVAASRQGGGLL